MLPALDTDKVAFNQRVCFKIWSHVGKLKRVTTWYIYSLYDHNGVVLVDKILNDKTVSSFNSNKWFFTSLKRICFSLTHKLRIFFFVLARRPRGQDLPGLRFAHILCHNISCDRMKDSIGRYDVSTDDVTRKRLLLFLEINRWRTTSKPFQVPFNLNVRKSDPNLGFILLVRKDKFSRA